MLNAHKIISVVLGLLYMIVLQVFSNPVPVFRFLLPAFLGVLLTTFLYNLYYLRHQEKYNFWVVIRPLLLQASGFLLFLVLFNSFYRGMFFILSVMLITFFELTLTKYSENILLSEILIVLFGFIYALMGLLQTFPSLGYWFLIAVFLALFLLARAFFEFIPGEPKMKLLNGLVISFLGAEIFWSASFLHFHYSVLAALTFIFVYVMLVLNFHYLLRTLTAKQIKFYLSLAGVSLLLIFSATPWTIVD